MPGLGYHAEPVAVAIEGEPDLVVGARQAANDILQILGLRRIGMMIRKVAVDLAEKLGYRAAEAAKQGRCERAGHAVAAIDSDLERTRELDVAGDAIEVRRRDVGGAIGSRAATQVAALDARLQGGNRIARQRLAGDHHLEAVIVGRIMAAGDGDAALRGELVRGEIAHRRGDHADVDDMGTARPDSVAQRASELGARIPPIARDDDRVAPALLRQRSERLPDSMDDRRRQRLADNPANVVSLEDVGGQLHRR